MNITGTNFLDDSIKVFVTMAGENYKKQREDIIYNIFAQSRTREIITSKILAHTETSRE
jgi:hypothetical protein